VKNWREEWLPFEDVTYLNVAGQSPLPKVSIQAAGNAIEMKTFPNRLMNRRTSMRRIGFGLPLPR